MNSHWLSLVFHHIIFDTWSLGIFARELATIYEAYALGSPITLEDLPIQYADYSDWQRRPSHEARLAKQLSYWRDKLNGSTELIRLPTTNPRGRFTGQLGNTESFRLGGLLGDSVTTFCQRESLTPFVLFLATLTLLLHRYTGDRDLTLSSALGSRKYRNTDSLIGCFTNTVPFRIPIVGNPSVRSFLHDVREVVIGSYENSDIPFEQMLAGLGVSRNLSYTPFAQVMLIVQDADLRLSGKSGLEITRLPIVERTSAQQDLTIHIRYSGSNITGIAEFNPDLIQSSTIREILQQFEQLLNAIVASPSGRISNLRLLGADETLAFQSQAESEVPDNNGTGLPHHQIALRAANGPDLIALVCGDIHVSYGELDRLTLHVADKLACSGIELGARVALCISYSPLMVAACLAIWRVGATCIPIDPGIPKSRVRNMVNVADVQLVLCDNAHSDHFTSTPVPHLDLSLASTKASRTPSSNGLPRVNVLDQLAYVLSTANAEDSSALVMGTYRVLEAAVHRFTERLGVADYDVCVTATPIHVSRAFVEIVSPLTKGCKVTMVETESHLPDAFAQAIDVSRATLVQSTPLVWRSLLEHGWSGRPGLRIVSTDDHLPIDLASHLAATGANVWNAYGSTEAGACIFCERWLPNTPVSVGKPTSGDIAYVLDEYLQPVPAGIAGRLYLAGPHLGRGYLNRPDLTAEHFLPDPYAVVPGSTMHRTSDQVSWTKDGRLVFLYSTEPCTQLQGTKVSLGNIQATLESHPRVSKAIVIPRGSPTRGKQLIAYLSCAISKAQGSPLSAKDIREFWKMQLPEHLWPADAVVLPSLPIAPSGKVSRRGLPDPATWAAAHPTTFEAPITDMQRMLAEIWSNLLRIDRIGITDDFFAVGGDSLKAQRMLVEIERRLTIDIPIYLIFVNPTIEQLAMHLERLKKIGMSDDEELTNIVANLSDEEVTALLSDLTKVPMLTKNT